MDEKIAAILDLSDQCTLWAKELTSCLEKERLCLIEFRTEDLLQNNITKDELVICLQRAKQSLRSEILKSYGSREALENLPGEAGHQWRVHHSEWLRTWEKLKYFCESNQDFLKHSLKTLDMMTENLKRLFHQQSLYNAKGNRVEAKTQGNVVEASY